MSEHGKIFEAMVAAFAEMPAIPKTRYNKQHNSYYMNIDDVIHAVRPVLAKHGLAFTQPPVPVEGDFVAVRTVLIHKSGETFDAGITTCPSRPIARRNEEAPPANAHSFGSGYTYARRYGLCAALCISDQDDDDGNAAAAGNGGQNGHGRPVARQTSAGAADFLKAVINETKMDQADAKALCGDICKKLGINKANATPDDWARCIATVKDKGDAVFAWISEGE